MARSSMFLRWTNDNMEAGSRRTFTQEEVRFGLRWWLLWVDNAGLSKVCIFNTTGFKRTNEFFCILISVLLSWRLFCWLIRVLMYTLLLRILHSFVKWERNSLVPKVHLVYLCSSDLMMHRVDCSGLVFGMLY